MPAITAPVASRLRVVGSGTLTGVPAFAPFTAKRMYALTSAGVVKLFRIMSTPRVCVAVREPRTAGMKSLLAMAPPARDSDHGRARAQQRQGRRFRNTDGARMGRRGHDENLYRNEPCEPQAFRHRFALLCVEFGLLHC